ncbi:MAG: DNA helicase RecQ [Gammaproteobacteria bacterium]
MNASASSAVKNPTDTSTALQILQAVYGYDAFRGQQQAAIERALAGQDSLVLMPTGGGKSVCYQIPAQLGDGTVLVVSPLIALMQDQVSALQELNVPAAFLNSSLSHEEQDAVIGRLKRGELRLLYIAPERLIKAHTRALLRNVPLTLIAIDEAHCVSQWGHDFREDYLALHNLREWFPEVSRMALTATATELTRNEIIERLALTDAAVLISDFDRPNIRYRVQPKTDGSSQLDSFLRAHKGEAGIIYCLSRKKTESTAARLSKQGYTALPYHAGLPAETRAEHQRRFLLEDGVIIVATIAFGMGIDKPDVRFVAHLDLPKSLEAYYQETGRAGRDGEPAEAWMIYGLQDVVRLRQMADESTAGEEYKRHERQKLDTLLGWCEITQCRRAPLLAYFGEAPAAAGGNGDNWQQPPATRDGTEDAQKLLSAVYRTGQLFGAAHVADVLLGKSTDKIHQHGHAQLSVYGIGKDKSAQAWRSAIRQLVVQGCLRVDTERFGALTLTDTSRAVLRGEQTVQLRIDPAAPKGKRRSGSATPAADITGSDLPLWEALRECRQILAAEHGVPPYVIFHDSTLRQMLSDRPTNAADFLMLTGVGQAKLDRYGAEFMAVIQGSG